MRDPVRRAPVSTGALALAALAVCCVFAETAGAQTCFGRSALGSGKSVLLGAGAGFTSESSSVSGRAAVAAGSIIALARASKTSYDNSDFVGYGVGGTVGVQVHADQRRTVAVCPFFTADRDWFPEQAGVSAITVSGSGGINIGAVAAESETVAFVPFGGVSFGRYRQTVKYQGAEDSESGSHGYLTIGAGFVFHRTIGITSSVSKPFGSQTTDNSYNIVASFAF